MMDFAALTKISNSLVERYGAQGKVAADRLQAWLEGAVPMTFPEVLARHLEERAAHNLCVSDSEALLAGQVKYDLQGTAGGIIRGECEMNASSLLDNTEK